jgi:hypothetical protein
VIDNVNHFAYVVVGDNSLSSPMGTVIHKINLTNWQIVGSVSLAAGTATDPSLKGAVSRAAVIDVANGYAYFAGRRLDGMVVRDLAAEDCEIAKLGVVNAATPLSKKKPTHISVTRRQYRISSDERSETNILANISTVFGGYMRL